jgi:hypothetical protein
MHIDTSNHSFLLFMEPVFPATEPIVDIYTRKITGAIVKSKAGSSGYGQSIPHFCIQLQTKGIHHCDCGRAHSTTQDYLMVTKEPLTVTVFSDSRSFLFSKMENSNDAQAVITNSLAIHYVACHRNEIPAEVLERILLLDAE